MRPSLYATPEIAEAIADARAAVVLVGGYDGSGNFGDIALLEAALDLLEPVGPGLILLPILERTFLEDHRALAEHANRPGAHPIYFDPDGTADDGLVSIGAPADLAFGACYLYGGGYLNQAWGNRKLAMLRAATALFQAGGANSICRISSGLQAEAGWVSALDDGNAATLRSFDLLGVRDRDSGRALDQLQPETPTRDTGDDAIGVLRRLSRSDAAGTSNGHLHVNLHFAEHGWVSERPGEVLDFYLEFLAELGRLSEQRLAVRPLIAYLDPRVDERPGVARLRSACVQAGVEVAEPFVLRPAELAQIAPEIGAASLTLSCSYHVALTSLMLEVPAMLLGDNPYYAQKAAGLAEDFGLPEAFTPRADDDPRHSAQAIAEAVLDRTQAPALRQRLAAGATRLRHRRAATEAELMAHLGGAAITALSERIDEVSERLRERAAEPSELRAQLASDRTEREAWERRARRSNAPLEAELRAREAELRAQEAEADTLAAHQTLASVLGSSSWRLLAPLRRVGSWLRRLRDLLRKT